MYKNILLHLSLIEGVGASTIKYIFDNSKDSDLNLLYDLSITDIVNKFELNPKKAELIYNGLKDKYILDHELELIQKNNIQIFSLDADDYPYLLKQISSPPAILYVQGNIANLENSIAIVGSRKASFYGKSVVQKLIPDLINANFSIISGGAFGIDSIAHQETLNSGGKTVAILGSGLLRPYPDDNKKLFENIINNNGALVSSFPLMFEPLPGNFPARNRIIAGLSKGTIVIQAAQKSGALITAHYALEQNREVFAVPGNINDELSAGCNNLIKAGAKIVICAEDILEEFGFSYARFNTKTYEPVSQVLEVEDPIIAVCVEPRSLEEIVELTGMELSAIQIKLFDLQIEQKIEQNFAGLWQAV